MNYDLLPYQYKVQFFDRKIRYSFANKQTKIKELFSLFFHKKQHFLRPY